jgi:hypothetical protein
MARANKKKPEFDWTEYVKRETEASGVPSYVTDPATLAAAATLVRSVLEAKRET